MSDANADSIIAFGRTVAASTGQPIGVRAARLGDRPVWVKWRDVVPHNVFHRMQRAIRPGGRWAILRHSGARGPESIPAEAARHAAFAARGIRVPEVIASAKSLMVLEDAGPEMRKVLRAVPDHREREALLALAVEALAGLHQAALCHGRPWLRDMARQDGGIAFLDLEEDPMAVMPPADAQARDIWLFMVDAARFVGGDTATLARILRVYMASAPPGAVERLRELVHALRPARRVAELLIAPWAPADIGRAVAASRAMEFAFAERRANRTIA
jgi:hypothetical protein